MICACRRYRLGGLAALELVSRHSLCPCDDLAQHHRELVRVLWGPRHSPDGENGATSATRLVTSSMHWEEDTRNPSLWKDEEASTECRGDSTGSASAVSQY